MDIYGWPLKLILMTMVQFCGFIFLLSIVIRTIENKNSPQRILIALLKCILITLNLTLGILLFAFLGHNLSITGFILFFLGVVILVCLITSLFIKLEKKEKKLTNI